MKFLPSSLIAVDASVKPLPEERSFCRMSTTSPENLNRREEHWDAIICANVEGLSEALRAADVLPEDSSLVVLGRQIDNVDVLLAEVARYSVGADEQPEIRRLVLLEDKLVRNPEAKRQVLAQVLDYAERAQQVWTTKVLCSNPRLARHAAWLGRNAQRLDVSLAEGDLLVVIAGDDIDDDLLRLARRFAGADNPLSLTELCLVSMPLYRRGEEYLLVPHVVSAVERHHRQFTIRVRVQDAAGTPLHGTVERDVEADVEAARRDALPRNPDVEAFLVRAKKILDPQLLAAGSPYEGTRDVRKVLEYWTRTDDGSHVRFKIHFGGYDRTRWSPIQVGLYVESKELREHWRDRIERALAEGRLPIGTQLVIAGKQTAAALKDFAWSAPSDLTDLLLRDVTDALVRIESLFGSRAQAV